jgi:(E)-4-hydroxy-3-methyl-but-2-enyl pyrophosphate reductase (IPP and DMAPP forming)
MIIKTAKTAGFCMGVRRAMELVLDEIHKGTMPLYTYGPLIHNKQALEHLESKGVKIWDGTCPDNDATVVIRAHGVPPSVRNELKAAGINIINGTCPKVARVQSIIKSYSRKNHSIIIIGDKDHAEVLGLIGYSKSDTYVIGDISEIDRLPYIEKACVVAQTTQHAESYYKIIEILKKKIPSLHSFDTICDATTKRQYEIKKLASETDCVVVVGGFHSANTIRLTKIASETGSKVIHIETQDELDLRVFDNINSVSVTAGASTPNWLIESVIKKIDHYSSIRKNKKTFILKRFLFALVASNFFGAIGTASLMHSFFFHTAIQHLYAFSFIVFFYIYSMHILNRIFDEDANARSDPTNKLFLLKNRNLLITSSFIAILIAMVITLAINLSTFFTFIFISGIGISYSFAIIPIKSGKKSSLAVKHIPGLKGFAEGMAITVFAILAYTSSKLSISFDLILNLFFISACLFFKRIFLENILIQRDMMIGVPTIPILLGEKQTVKFLKSLLVLLFLIIIVATVSSFSYFYYYLVPAVGLTLCFIFYIKNPKLSRINFELLLDFSFILLGLLTLKVSLL